MRLDATVDGELAAFLPLRVRVTLWIVTAFAILLISVPLLYLFIWSLCGTEVVGRVRSLADASFSWYWTVLRARDWRDALAASLQLALGAAFLGVWLVAAYDYARRFHGKTVHKVTWLGIAILLTNPLIPYGMSLRFIATQQGISPWIILALGHLAIVLPLQFFVFQAAARHVDSSTLEAAKVMGATDWRAFFYVYMPVSARPWAAAFIIGAFVSFDELVIALFTLEGAATTVPLKIWRSIGHVAEPHAAVVASLVVLVASVAWTLFGSVSRQSGKWVRGRWDGLAGQRKELAGALAGVAAARLSLPHGEGAWHFLAEAVVHVAGALAGWLVVGLWKLRRILRGLLFVVNSEPRGSGKVAQRFVLPGVRADFDALEALLGGGLVLLNRQQIRRLTAACFREFRRGRYVGTDRNVPSKYFALYPDYLETQLRDRGGKVDVRLVLYEPEELREDIRAFPAETQRFLETHWKAGVLLLCVPWSYALESARRHRLESPDLGVFQGRLALFFLPSGQEGEGLVMMRRLDGALRLRLTLFLSELADKAQEIVRGDGGGVAFRQLGEEEHARLRSAIERR